MPQSAPGQSLNQKVRRFAASQGAELIGFAPPERYPQYVRELAGRVAGRRIRAVVILGVSALNEAVDYRRAVRALQGRSSDPLTKPLSRSMGGWFRGCDICQEVCPLNRKLTPRSADPWAGYDSAHHSSHRFLDGCERLPRLLPLLAPSQPALIRRNAAIALGNIGRGRERVGQALRHYAGAESGELRQYFRWALENVERRL